VGNRFAISDHHFAHNNIYRFTDDQGQRIRPWAQSAEEADEMMIDAWNSVVNERDIVYNLGDVSITRKGLSLLSRLNGRVRLVGGNHDIFKLKDYLPYFEDIKGSYKVGRMIMTHYPIHPESIPHWCLANVHGHIHQNTVMKVNHLGERVPDVKYFNLSIEAVGLAPLPLEEVERRIAELQGGPSDEQS
jgi:calcineurin-like phosphoesterase family protein